MSHKHDHCEHELKYCGKCDVVWCAKCDREWGGHVHNWIYSYPYYTTTPYYTGTPIYTTDDPITICGNDTDVSSSNVYAVTTTPHEHVCS